MRLKNIKPELKETIVLALPMAGAQLSQVLMGVTDNMVVGSLGAHAVAALGLALSTFYPLMLAGMGCVLAVNPMVAHAFGAEKRSEIGKIARSGLLGVMLIGALVVFFLQFSETFLTWMKQSPQTRKDAAAFLQVYRWTVFTALGFIALRGFLEGMSITRPAFFISVVGIFLNYILNWGLVQGLWGFPKWGFLGSAYATLFSQGFMLIALWIYTILHKEWRALLDYSNLFKLDIPVIKEMLQIGLPIGVALFIEVVLFAGTAFLMGTLGTAELAANQIAINTASVTFMMAVGIGLATTTRVGQAMGRGEPEVAKRAGYLGMFLGMLLMGTLGLLFLIFPRPIVGLYIDLNDPENAKTIALSIQLLAIAALFQVFDALQVTAGGAMRGIKQTVAPMFLGLIGYWGVGLTSGYFLCFAKGWGAAGLWYGETLGLATTGILLFWAFKNYFKRVLG